ncbi:DedA family protein [Paracoccus sp. S-4012]|uniref:DedA family protein n=1 Tax=Paracoccus sp. S-4012 TaxID=2665648 RepID=UPI0012B00743|nr:DedA family protein [Paracoccus sp. S-4012]MRX51314.1 DedA family protein [Paracoccus sp. S-4012]
MIDWIANLIAQIGPLGVALLMFLENVFPPIPSELIMPLAGFNAAQGTMSLPVVILAGTAGSLAGATLWYLLGRAVGAERIRRLAARHGRWLTVSPGDVDRASAWFDRHGGKAVFFGRLVPAVRTLISIPAGLAGMPLGRFLGWSALGSLLWTTFLAIAGYMLEGAYARVERWVDPVSTFVVIAVVVIYVWRVITWKPHR